MFQLVYASSAVSPFSRDDLLDLLARSRSHNARTGVTGMLLYKDGNFLQALEGEEADVRATHARIERDRRHRGLLTLLQGPLAERRFPQWSMGLGRVDAAEVSGNPGLNRFLATPWTGREFAADPSSAERLLMMFKKSM